MWLLSGTIVASQERANILFYAENCTKPETERDIGRTNTQANVKQIPAAEERVSVCVRFYELRDKSPRICSDDL